MANAIVSDPGGVNINHGGSNYLTAFPDLFDSAAMKFGYFRGADYTDAPQYGLAANWETIGYTGGTALLATGELTYDISTHELTGQLDSLAFGEELNGVTPGLLPGTSYTDMSLGSTKFTLSNLGLDSANGDDVHGILYGIMNGDETGLLNYLATHSVTFTGGSGADAYQGGSQADVLNGGGGADTLSGGGGADTINGGAGVDLLTGGAGNDIFAFASYTDSSGSSIDTITDFKVSGSDKIDLSALIGGVFNWNDDIAGSSGDAWYETSGSNTDVFADTGSGILKITLANFAGSLSAGDFIL